MEERVTLIIKAANQSSPDQRLECDLQWSISTLKGHLAKAHPSHPNTEEQRLIYSGQLLADNHLLCNVLRRPSEDNAYTIHLVCSPPPPSQPPCQPCSQPSQSSPTDPTPSLEAPGLAGMPSPNPNSSSSSGSPTPSPPPPPDGQAIGDSTDGVRRRHPPTTTPPTLDAPGPPPTPTPTMLQVGGLLQPSADPIHQVAAMQQIYAHYMAYVQYMQMGGGVGGLPWPQQMIQIPPPPNPATATTTAAATTTAPTTAPTEPAEQPQPDPNVAADPQPQPQQQQPIRMNAQGGEVEEDEEEEGAGRDWLDWVYVLSRMLVLLSIVYFYSTLSRFMVVVFIAMLLYLYQAGWFRPSRRVDAPPPQQAPHHPQQQQQDPINNNNNNNNNDLRRTPPEEEDDDDDEEDDDEEEEEAAPTREQVQGGSEGGGGEGEVPVTVRPSLLSLSWTFLTTFFTSLIPEQPQGI